MNIGKLVALPSRLEFLDNIVRIFRRHFDRALLAWRFFRATWSEDDAWHIAREAYSVMGLYPLESLEVERVLEDTREIYQDHPDLPQWAQDACERVYGKWSSDGDLASGAREWALNLIVENAQDDGVVLEKIDED